jgi:hypothetical protein
MRRCGAVLRGQPGTAVPTFRNDNGTDGAAEMRAVVVKLWLGFVNAGFRS